MGMCGDGKPGRCSAPGTDLLDVALLLPLRLLLPPALLLPGACPQRAASLLAPALAWSSSRRGAGDVVGAQLGPTCP